MNFRTPEVTAWMEGQENVFFKPTDAFWEYLKDIPWRWKHYIDVGCGTGHLTRLMREKGYDVTGVDLYPRDNAEIPDTVQCDVTGLDKTYRNRGVDMSTNDCMIFARPCHGMFVPITLSKYHQIGEYLYAGLDRNVEGDLFGWKSEKVAENVGQDGEHLWRIWGKIGLMKEFHILENGTVYEYKNGRWQNPNGGGFTPSPKELASVREVVDADHDMMFYYDLREERQDGNTGWLAPDGSWYGCSSSGHEFTAYHVIGSNTAHLEKIGFIRCYGLFHGHMMWAFGDHVRFGQKERPPHKATLAQKKVLREKGYDPKDDGEAPSEADFPL